MKTSTRLLGLIATGLFMAHASLDAQCIDCGTGSDGAYTATTNTSLVGGTYNFTSFSIAPGVTVTVAGTQPLIIKATGIVTIDGVLSANGGAGTPGVTYVSAGAGGLGVASGGDGGAGAFHPSNGPIDGVDGSGPGLGQRGIGWCGGGGAGYANSGSSSGGASGGFGGAAYGDPQLSAPNVGSGGGGGSGGNNCGSGGGGGGGGFISISSCSTIVIGAAGQITADGGNGGSDGGGNCGGGGGGSGGSIWLRALGNITHIGTIRAVGGTGGASNVAGSPYFGTGAAGSVGRIRIDGTVVGGSGSNQPPAYMGAVTSLAIQLSSSDLSCNGDSSGQAMVTATSGSIASVMWSTGATTAAISGLPAGCYTVQVSDSSNCTFTDSVCLVEPSALQAFTLSQNTPCAGACLGWAAADVVGGSVPYTFAWTGSPSTSDSITGLCAGSYVLTVTDSLGCTASDTVAIEEPAALVVILSSNPSSTTTSNDGSAINSSTGGTPPYAYLWTPGGGTTATITGLAPGLYTCVTTDSNGCVDSSTVSVDVLIGLPNRLEFLSVTAYPNPSQGMLMVKIENPRGLELVLEAIDMQGRLLKQVSLEGTATLEHALDARQWADGNYLILLRSPEGQAVERVRIAR